jgi:hypothetical protein
MTSLSYHAEHRAWQERVMRESQSSGQYKRFLHQPRPSSRPASRTMMASNPNMLRDQLFHHAPVKYRAVLQVTSKSNSSTGRSHPYASLRDPSRSYFSSTYNASYSVPAEVRGKYARPASNVSKLTNESEAVSQHPLLSLPVTAGSLMRKSFTDAALQVNLSRPPSSRSQTFLLPGTKALSRPQTAFKPSTASRPQTVSIPHTASGLQAIPRPPTASRPQTAASKGTRPSTVPKELIDRIVQLQQTESKEEPLEQAPEAEGDGGEGDDLAKSEAVEAALEEPSRPPTATTWKTTSSQRHYIDELERLLREERKVNFTQRRIQAESQLSDLVPLSRQ